jgi:lipid-A-disaccharide synthase-like uncharacterized protein
MKRKHSRQRLVVVAFLLLVLPAAVWSLLLALGYVGTPGNPVRPPFNVSDRIVTIDVQPDGDGQLRATFDGWPEGVPGMSGDDFFDELHRRQRNLPWIYRFFDVTSLTGVFWVLFGFAGQGIFTARMIVQWHASEKAKNSIVPPVFWWLSILGASMLMVYFVWRKDIVGFLGQSTGWLVYIRNLWFIYGREDE